MAIEMMPSRTEVTDKMMYWNHLYIEYKICAERFAHQLKNYAYLPLTLMLMRVVKAISVSRFLRW